MVRQNHCCTREDMYEACIRADCRGEMRCLGLACRNKRVCGCSVGVLNITI